MLGKSLTNRLLAFRDAIDAFAYPKDDMPLFKGRLAVRGEDVQDKYSVDLPKDGEALSYYKYLSWGLDKNAATDLAAGEYQVDLKLGDEEQRLTFNVGEDWTNADLAQAFADGVNGSTLGVRAHLLDQSYPGQEVPGQLATGLSVALSVNAAREEQDVSLANAKGLMLQEFDFRAVNDPVGPADTGRYQLSEATPGRESVFRTAVFDPGADNTMNPGEYSFDWSLGEESGTFSVAVSDGDTWQDVLDRLVSEANGSQEQFTAEKKTVDAPVYQDGRTLSREEQLVEFSALNPKVEERLSISGGGHLLDGEFSVSETFEGGYAATVSEDQYDAYSTGTRLRVSSSDTLPGGLSADTDYYAVRLDPDQYGFRIGFAASLADAEAGNTIGLTSEGTGDLSIETQGTGTEIFDIATAWPGTDTRIRAEGTERTLEAGGLLSLDDGRVTVDVADSFSGTLPFSVVEPMERMERTLGDAVSEYNNLRSFILSNQDLFRDTLAEQWRGPLQSRMDVLQHAGFSELGERKLLQVAFDDLFARITADPQEMRETLVGEDGLLPAWHSEVESVLQDPDSWLVPETSVTDDLYPPPEPLTEIALETKSRLVDTLDDLGTEPTSPFGGGLVNMKG